MDAPGIRLVASEVAQSGAELLGAERSAIVSVPGKNGVVIGTLSWCYWSVPKCARYLKFGNNARIRGEALDRSRSPGVVSTTGSSR